MAIHTSLLLRTLAAGGIALAGSQAWAQDPNPYLQPQPASANSGMTSARAARSAQLLEEFRALLDASIAKRYAEASQGAVPMASTPPYPAVSGQSALVPPDSQIQARPEPGRGSSPAADENAYLPGSGAKDPAPDYSGLPCEFFTRPRNNDGSINFHPDGAWVAYGKRMYHCVNRRWNMEGLAEGFVESADKQAAVLER